MSFSSSQQRNKAMRAVKSSGSAIERRLGKSLWKKGYRYRKNCKNIIGKPDIVFRKYKIVIFCDSEFWHGKNFDIEMPKIKNNRDYWINKIKRNMARDKEVTKLLEEEGWQVIRFWGKDIEKHTEKCINKIERTIAGKKSNYYRIEY